MSRTRKAGLKYFPHDTDFFSDIKVRRIRKACGGVSMFVLMYVLCEIYRNKGYYLEYNDDMPFIISEQTSVSESEVEAIIKRAIEVDFFDKTIFLQCKILTSAEIQEQYLWICKQLKRDRFSKMHIEPAHNLIKHDEVFSPDETAFPPDEMAFRPDESAFPPDEMTQKKRKENKLKQTKENQSQNTSAHGAGATGEPSLFGGFQAGDNIVDFREPEKPKSKPKTDEVFEPPGHLAELWPDYLAVRRAKKAAVNPSICRRVINQLEKLAPSDNDKQCELLEQSILHGWVGVFEKNENKKGGSYGGTYGNSRGNYRAGFDATEAQRGFV